MVWQRASTIDTVNSRLTHSRSVAGSRTTEPPRLGDLLLGLCDDLRVQCAAGSG